jgi:hypothetical protein
LNRPTKLHASIGGYFGTSYDVELCDSSVRYSSSRGDDSRSIESLTDNSPSDVTLEPTDQEWNDFLRALDSLGVWEWSPEYIFEGVMDGTSWSLEISWGDRSVTSGGSNEFPPTFDRFLKAVSALVGWRVFQ